MSSFLYKSSFCVVEIPSDRCLRESHTQEPTGASTANTNFTLSRMLDEMRGFRTIGCRVGDLPLVVLGQWYNLSAVPMKSADHNTRTDEV